MFVKICGITNEEDALLSVAVGADAIGFVFAPSKRKIPVSKVADIVRRLPNDILTVGVFKDELPERVIKIINETGLMAAQLHGTESPSNVKIVKKEVRTVFKAVTAAGSITRCYSMLGAALHFSKFLCPRVSQFLRGKLGG